ncbi:hypothetical protein AAG570_010719 [Ranatra chinensis]|uniref:Uncharacterized protein n=1 Tax=Ranatra chinensis TaxID=642074 RepID=A0ABD0YNG4_9HEMI
MANMHPNEIWETFFFTTPSTPENIMSVDGYAFSSPCCAFLTYFSRDSAAMAQHALHEKRTLPGEPSYRETSTGEGHHRLSRLGVLGYEHIIFSVCLCRKSRATSQTISNNRVKRLPGFEKVARHPAVGAGVGQGGGESARRVSRPLLQQVSGKSLCQNGAAGVGRKQDIHHVMVTRSEIMLNPPPQPFTNTLDLYSGKSVYVLLLGKDWSLDEEVKETVEKWPSEEPNVFEGLDKLVPRLKKSN